MMNHYVNAWRHWRDFTGQTNRTQFWWFALVHFVLLTLFAGADAFMPVAISLPKVFVNQIGVFSGMYSALIFIPFLAISIRRLRDGGFSPWWVLIGAIPIIGFLMLLILFMQKTDTQDPNELFVEQTSNGIDVPVRYYKN